MLKIYIVLGAENLNTLSMVNFIDRCFMFHLYVLLSILKTLSRLQLCNLQLILTSCSFMWQQSNKSKYADTGQEFELIVIDSSKLNSSKKTRWQACSGLNGVKSSRVRCSEMSMFLHTTVDKSNYEISCQLHKASPLISLISQVCFYLLFHHFV